MVATVGAAPTTPRLSSACSTAELCGEFTDKYGEDVLGALPTELHPGSMARTTGLEPVTSLVP